MLQYISLLKSVSIANRYLDWYCRIIIRAAQRASNKKGAQELLGYVEGHHIVPRSFKLGGQSDRDNLVWLSAKEHILVHRLLCKFSQGDYLTCSQRAFHCMCFKNNGGQNKRYASNLQLAKAREANSIANSYDRGIKGVPSWFPRSTLEEFKTQLLEHTANNMSDPDIANLYGISATAVHNWRKKLGIALRRSALRDPDWLYQQYVVERLSTSQIATKLHCTGAAVQHYLHKFKIPIRDGSERQQNRHLKTKADTRL
jgi:predicted transcriptional regulator